MRKLYFFIGTEAEIMKMFMVIDKAKRQGFHCEIISSGQNDISDSLFLSLCDAKIDIDLAIYKPSQKNGSSYLVWLIKTAWFGIKYMRKMLRGCEKNKRPVMIVHGDTLSTLLGAIIAKSSGMPLVHVEGGLRSGHWFNPFPEEIDRYFSSKLADVVFCPTEEGARNAKRWFKGEVVSTIYNTNIETLQYAYQENNGRSTHRIENNKYFVAALHRQENLLSREFMEKAVDAIGRLAHKIHGVFIYHQQTMDTLVKFGLLKSLQDNPDITLIPRMRYLDFIAAVDQAEFLIADGAGNQQELYYMGKPYLILRRHIEKEGEGQNYNCIGFENNFERIATFDTEYQTFLHEKIIPEILPSDIIVKKILERYC